MDRRLTTIIRNAWDKVRRVIDTNLHLPNGGPESDHRREVNRLLADDEDEASEPTSTRAATKTTLEDMEQCISDVTSLSPGLADSMATLARETAESLQKASESLAEREALEEKLEVLAANASAFSSQMDTVKRAIRSNVSVIQEFLTGVRHPLEIHLQAAENVDQLQSHVEELGDIVLTVARIADQTNLLSLNAAIEASQAGEFGKGFTVVAGGIRNLAKVTERLTEEIRQLSSSVQSEVESIVDNVRNVASRSEKALEASREISQLFGEIDGALTGVSTSCDRVVGHADAHRNTFDELDETADDLLEISQTHQEAVTKVAQVIRRQARSFEHVRDEILQLQETFVGQNGRRPGAFDVRDSEQVSEFFGSVQALTTSQGEIAAAFEELSTAKMTQLDICRELVALPHDMQSTSTEMLEDCSELLEDAISLEEAFDRGTSELTDMISDLSDAVRLTENTYDQIRRLRRRVHEVNRVVDEVMNVTIQTTLLAVNGGIESARAGKAGEGFSIVASDVQTLAEESSANLAKIKDVLWSVEDRINLVKEDIDRTVIITRQQLARIEQQQASIQAAASDVSALTASLVDLQKLSNSLIPSLQERAREFQSLEETMEGSDDLLSRALETATEQARRTAALRETVEESLSPAIGSGETTSMEQGVT